MTVNTSWWNDTNPRLAYWRVLRSVYGGTTSSTPKKKFPDWSKTCPGRSFAASAPSRDPSRARSC